MSLTIFTNNLQFIVRRCTIREFTGVCSKNFLRWKSIYNTLVANYAVPVSNVLALLCVSKHLKSRQRRRSMPKQEILCNFLM
jgi:hypothetical protein